MDIAHYATQRRTAKAFDASRSIAPETLKKIETLLRYAPSSTNLQPWHFIIAGSEQGKARVAKAMSGAYAFNEAKVLNASHVVVLCSRATVDEAYLATVLEQEQADGRFASEQAREGQHRGRSMFVNTHRFEQRDAQQWMDKQVYLALGTLLLGVATLGVDACPMEGFDQKALDEELGLRAQGLTSAVVVSLGYSSAQDFNAALPKSRLPEASVLTRL